jgi:hypothetical protein
LPRTYDPAKLAPVNLTSDVWALTYLRLALRDKPNELGAWPVRGYSDEELLVKLELSAVATSDAKLYAPHRVAANIVLSNPEYIKSYSGGGFGETYRSAEEIAAGIIAEGAPLERLLPDAAGNTVELGW